MTDVNARRPLVYLCVAGVLALGASLIGGTGSAAPAGPPSGPGATTAAPPAAPACTDKRESLRPAGPLPAPGQMPAGSAMAAIVARGRLVVGVDQSNYLLSFRNPGTTLLEGSDIDVVHQIAKALFGDPDRVQFVVLSVADRPAAIAQKRVDLVVDNFTVTCERQKTVEFSSAYLAATTRLLVPLNSGISEVEQLAGKRVCTSKGSTIERVLHAIPAGLDVVALPGTADCVVELQRGRVDAVSSDDVILAGIAAQDPQTHVVGRALDSSLYAVGMNPEAPDLVRFVNGVLERGRADGSLAASYQRWLGRQLTPPPTPPPARYGD
ncbi:glutamate ABC transporter substrate-binding protein [Pseudonocardia sp. GCM10023141]|uniref:glutamate ABC transporter substrate-binding protein n=1 Tax=Pseudonocardia sp. GCM10023141 TaxID=3252653 RepID=UPI00360F04D8